MEDVVMPSRRRRAWLIAGFVGLTAALVVALIFASSTQWFSGPQSDQLQQETGGKAMTPPEYGGPPAHQSPEAER
jgi:hypothetical protein